MVVVVLGECGDVVGVVDGVVVGFVGVEIGDFGFV